MNVRLVVWLSLILSTLSFVEGCEDVDRREFDAGVEGLAIRWAENLGLPAPGFPAPRATCVAVPSLGRQATHRCDVLIHTNRGPVIYLLDCDRSACIHRIGECVR